MQFTSFHRTPSDLSSVDLRVRRSILSSVSFAHRSYHFHTLYLLSVFCLWVFACCLPVWQVLYALASLWEGIIAFRTLLIWFFVAASLRRLADFPRLTPYVCIGVFLMLIESTEQFVLRSFFLYLYYSTYFLFVKGFLKKSWKNFKIFFGRWIFPTLYTRLSLDAVLAW